MVTTNQFLGTAPRRLPIATNNAIARQLDLADNNDVPRLNEYGFRETEYNFRGPLKMAKTTFDTNPVSLQTLLKACEDGKLQLPDFQRSWVWEEERIMSLIASVSRGFPMGALMSLKSKIGEGCDLRATPHRGRARCGGTDTTRATAARRPAAHDLALPELHAPPGRLPLSRPRSGWSSAGSTSTS